MANATLTHMIKMAEPLCTMLGMMLVGQSELDFKLMVIMMLVIVSAFGSQPAASNIVGSASGILMALGSNTFYASRNIGSKTSKENVLGLPANTKQSLNLSTMWRIHCQTIISCGLPNKRSTGRLFCNFQLAPLEMCWSRFLS